MNKKIFATALFALAAFVSTGASAAITYGNSVGTGAQTANALVNPGGTSRANDLTIIAGTPTTDVPADSEVIIRLPAGLNFSGAPTYLVTPATVNQGLTLKDNTQFGDPTLGTDAGVDLFDTNADGGMDRAVVTVSAAALAGDSLTVTVNVAANSDATTGTKKASIIVNGGLAQTVDVVEVTNDVITGVISSTGTDLVTVDQAGYTSIDVSTPTFGIVIPAGAKNGDTFTLIPEGKVQWDGTSTLTISDVFTPVAINPLTGTILVGTSPAGATSTVTVAVQGAPATGFANDVVVELTLDVANITAGSAVGDYGITVAGTAGVTGTADLFSVKQNGSSAALATGATLTTIVTGSSAVQTLPSITITENFDGDALAGTPTVTITAGAGLVFAANTSTITISDGGATINVAAGTSTTSVITLNLTDAATTKTITISGIGATIAAGTSGNVSLTVGGASIDSATGPNNTLEVATGVAVGTVSVTGPATLSKVGPTAAGQTTAFTLKETTYGSISRANYSTSTTPTGTETQEAYFRVTPTNATITAVSLTTTSSYTVPGSDPTFNGGAAGPATAPCVIESAGAATWICTVFTESTALTPGTDTVTVDITYTASGSIGDTVSMSFDGNAAVAGSGDVATIVINTDATKGAVPILTEGSVAAQTLATLTITEKFVGGLGNGTFRLLAPAGVVFDASAGGVTYPSALTASMIVDTFAVGDTLEISTPATPSITITAKVIVAGSVSGYMDFQILDGTSGATAANKTGVTEVSAISLGYADKSLTALDAGAAIAVNAGFAATNTVSGGLIGDGYTVASSNTAAATATISGTTLTVKGVAAGTSNVTVTDELGGTDVVVVTVSAGAAQTAAPKTVTSTGETTAATFTAGATSDGGTTFATEFAAGDSVTMVGTVNVDPADQGSAGEVLVIVRSTATDGTQTWAYLNTAGTYDEWDLTIPGLGAHVEAASLGASYSVDIFSGELAAGTHRVALGYSVGSKIVYAGKALVITVTE